MIDVFIALTAETLVASSIYFMFFREKARK